MQLAHKKMQAFSMKLPIGNEMALRAVKYRAGARCEMSATYKNIKSKARSLHVGR